MGSAAPGLHRTALRSDENEVWGKVVSARRVAVSASAGLMLRLTRAIFRNIQRHRAMSIVHRDRFEAGGVRYWIALSSLLLILVFNTLETTHTHANTSGDSTRCAICISVIGNVPAVAAHPLPVLRTVAIVAARHQPQRESAAAEPTLFIRPPPAI
jgi:hypothetical protein